MVGADRDGGAFPIVMGGREEIDDLDTVTPELIAELILPPLAAAESRRLVALCRLFSRSLVYWTTFVLFGMVGAPLTPIILFDL